MSSDDIDDLDDGGPEEQFEQLDHDYARSPEHFLASGSGSDSGDGDDSGGGGDSEGDTGRTEGEAETEIPERSITDEMLRDHQDRADSWLVWNKDLQQRGFAPTDAITPENVDQLELEYEVGGMDPAPDIEKHAFKGNEPRANPLIVPTDPPVLYVTESNYKVHALNARTGAHFWSYKPEMPPPEKIGGIHGWHRGAAVYGDTVYIGLPTVEMLALNRYTGEKRWRKDYFSEEQREMPSPNRISVTQAPVVYDGKIFVGQTGDFGGWTVMSAIDAESGESVWHQRTSPPEQWVEDTWRYSSTAPWLSPSIDPESDTVFWSIGNPNPWFFPSARPGPNKYADSVIALDVESGEMKWVNQILPHDVWDYDNHMPPTVFDMEVEHTVHLFDRIKDDLKEAGIEDLGAIREALEKRFDDLTVEVTEERRVVSTDFKTGHTYVFDVETGRLIERSDAWAKQEHEWADSFLSLPPLGKENRGKMWPSVWGATEWPPDTYHPEKGLRYIGVNNVPSAIWRAENWEFQKKPTGAAKGGGNKKVKGGDHWASVKAIDPSKGEVAWEHRLDHVKPEWPAPRLFTGGTTATADDVVFHGSSSGYLKALHADTGELLWEDKTDRRIYTSPVIWEDPAQEEAYVTVFADEQLYTYSVSADENGESGDGGGNE